MKRILPKRHGDDHGCLFETFLAEELARAGIAAPFIQDNQSFAAPWARSAACTSRCDPSHRRSLSASSLVPSSTWPPTYGRRVAVRLDAEGGKQLFIPDGFAHSLCTLTPNVMIAYKVNAYYSSAHDRGIAWNDPDLIFAWPFYEVQAVLSDKDRKAPRLRKAGPLF